jgi:hypothetical protein
MAESRAERRRREREARKRDRYGPEGRPHGMRASHGEPTFDLPKFNLWKKSADDVKVRTALITVDVDAGEDMFESWVWALRFPGGEENLDDYELKILSKINREGRIWAVGALQRPDGSTVCRIGSKTQDWTDEAEYRQLIASARRLAVETGNLRPPTVTRQDELRRMREEFTKG